MALDHRAIIVARPGVAAAMNQAAADIDPGGQFTFTVQLRVAGDATNTVVGFWCSWALTLAQWNNLLSRMLARGATVSETTPILAGDTPVLSNRVFFFDGRAWTPQQVLDVLGVDRLAGQ